MASNIPNVMIFAQACEIFTSEHLPQIRAEYEQDGEPDIPARCEAWNDWTDAMCKDRQISDWQYNNWSHPPCND